MRLYFSPSACSLCPHIVLREAGLEFEPVRVNLAAKTTQDGADYRAINPKGYVPTLELDDGRVLTENPAVVQYLADLVPEKNLAPKAESFERYRLQEWLNFISTELHKQFSPLFREDTPEATREANRTKIRERLAYLSGQLKGKSYLMGETFSVADAYLFVTLRWTSKFNIDLPKWPNLVEYAARIEKRPAVQAALAFESSRG
jgi:glutathione S-transferase